MYEKVTHRSWDDSYVIEKNGFPYHVPKEGEWSEKWKNVNEYARLHPEKVKEEQEFKPTLEEIKSVKLSEINAAYDSATSALVSTYPQTELLTFDKQESEARAWQADNLAKTPLVDMLAAGRQIDKAELARRIIAKADAFALATGYLTGQRQRYEDLLDEAQTVEDVEAIVPEYVMPQGLSI